MTAPNRFDAGADGAIDEPLDAFEVLRRDERADSSALLARIADGHMRCGGAKLLEKLVRVLFIDEDAGARQADLAGIEILRSGSLRCRIEVCIRANNKRRFAAKLESDRGERTGA